MKRLFIRLVSLVMAAVLLLLVSAGCSLRISGKEKTGKDTGSAGQENDSVNPGIPFIGVTVEKTETITESVDGQVRLSVENPSGVITFKPCDRDRLEITAVKKLKAPGRKDELEKLLEDIQIEVRKNPGSISVNVKYLEGAGRLMNRNVNMEVMVPAAMTGIKGKVTSGEIALSGLTEVHSLDLSASSGNIRVEDTSSVNYEIELTSGNIDMKNFTGDGKIKVSSGNTVLHGIEGRLDFKATSGSLDIDGMEGTLTSDISSGNVDIKNAYLKSGSSFYVTSGRQDLRLTRLDSEGSYKFKASSGNIKVYLPGSAEFNLKAKAPSGNIRSDFHVVMPADDKEQRKNELEGAVGQGGPDIEAFVTSGNVSILKK